MLCSVINVSDTLFLIVIQDINTSTLLFYIMPEANFKYVTSISENRIGLIVGNHFSVLSIAEAKELLSQLKSAMEGK